MYLSLDQIRESLEKLVGLHPFFGMSFLAFKEADIPVGSSRELIFSQIVDVILDRHYRASETYEGYFNPFQTSNPSKRWLAPRYGSTSLQRITTDTFPFAYLQRHAPFIAMELQRQRLVTTIRSMLT